MTAISPDSMLVIGRGGEGDGPTRRRQRRFPSVEAGEKAIRRWKKEGFHTFWTRVGDGDLSKSFQLIDGERVYK